MTRPLPESRPTTCRAVSNRGRAKLEPALAACGDLGRRPAVRAPAPIKEAVIKYPSGVKSGPGARRLGARPRCCADVKARGWACFASSRLPRNCNEGPGTRCGVSQRTRWPTGGMLLGADLESNSQTEKQPLIGCLTSREPIS